MNNNNINNVLLSTLHEGMGPACSQHAVMLNMAVHADIEEHW